MNDDIGLLKTMQHINITQFRINNFCYFNKNNLNICFCLSLWVILVKKDCYMN